MLEESDSLVASRRTAYEDRIASYDSEPFFTRLGKFLSENKVALLVCTTLLFLVTTFVFAGLYAKSGRNSAIPSGDSTAAAVMKELATNVRSAMNFSVDPCTDFYEYSCGGWISSFTLPADKSAYTKSFNSIDDANTLALQDILQQDWPYVSTWYKNCMDLSAMTARGTAPLTQWLAQIDAATSMQQIMTLIGQFHSIGLDVFFNSYVEADYNDPTMNMLTVDQGGLTLPSKDYYFNTNNASVVARAALNTWIGTAMPLAGLPVQTDAILAVEFLLANASMSEEDRRDPANVYHKIGVQGLQNLSSSVDWDSYFAALGTSTTTVGINLNVANLGFFQSFGDLVVQATTGNTTALNDIQAYLRWQLVSGFSGILTEAMQNASFAFRAAIYGYKTMSPRWKTCVASTGNALGEILGRYYVETNFPGNSRAVALKMLAQLYQSMADSINSLPWMDATTRQKGLQKLAAITSKIGYPTNWTDYSNLFVKPGDYFDNVMKSNQWSIARQIAQIGQQVDTSIWMMNAFTVNAYYNPLFNEIVFPAGIMQGSFYNQSYPYASNFGGIGAVMGHEITHGFDDQGAQFDKDGRFNNWWTNETLIAFENRTACIEQQYDAYEVLPGLFINGKLTLGENIADNGGIKESFNAYRRQLSNDTAGAALQEKLIAQYFGGLTSDQLFFVAYAQNWCSVATDAYLTYLVTTNPHAPNKFRVNGPVSNFPEFATAFKCKANAPMNPDKKCSVW